MNCIVLCVSVTLSSILVSNTFSQKFDSIIVRSKHGIEIEVVYIAPGKFVMGRDLGVIETVGRTIGQEASAMDEGPAHPVTISKAFFIGRYKITVNQYCVFLNSVQKENRIENLIVLNQSSLIEKNDDGAFIPKKGCGNCAVGTVPWEGATAFCSWLSNDSIWHFRLPTEAEWEFTARGTEGRKFPWGNENSGRIDYDSKKSVDAFPHNTTPGGVVGLINSVGDWVIDYYSESYPSEAQVDPTGPESPLVKSGYTMGRVLRRSVHTAFEREAVKIGESGIAGFRVVLDISKCKPFGQD